MTDWYDTATERVDEANQETDEYDRELVTTGDMDAGDSVKFRFQSNGEEVETEYGDALAWDIVVTDPGEMETVEKAEEARFLTSSTRFLQSMLELGTEEVAGMEIDVIRTADGYDTQYRIEAVPETEQTRFD